MPRYTVANPLGSSIQGSEISIASQAQGDILYFNGTSWVRLAAGTSGHFLKTQGAAANPTWAQAAGDTTGTSSWGVARPTGWKTITGNNGTATYNTTLALATTTDANSYAESIYFVPMGYNDYDFVWKFSAASGAASLVVFFGLGSQKVAGEAANWPTDSCVFGINGNTANVSTVTCSAGTATEGTFAPTDITTNQTYTIKYNSNSVEFLEGGVSKATQATNVPTGKTIGIVFGQSASGAAGAARTQTATSWAVK